MNMSITINSVESSDKDGASVIDKMRKDTSFKRSIGGTKWSIDLGDVIIDIKEHDALNWTGVYSNGYIEPENALNRVISQDSEYPIVDIKDLIKKLHNNLVK